MINADVLATSGIDLEVAYRLDDLNIGFYANYLSEYKIETTGGVEEFLGRPQFPEFRYTINASYNITDELNIFAQMILS